MGNVKEFGGGVWKIANETSSNKFQISVWSGFTGTVLLRTALIYATLVQNYSLVNKTFESKRVFYTVNSRRKENEHVNKQTNKQTDSQTGRQTDKQTDRQADRQTESLIQDTGELS